MTNLILDLKHFPKFMSNKSVFTEETNKIRTPETFYKCGVCGSCFYHLTSFIVCCGNHLPSSINLTGSNIGNNVISSSQEDHVFVCKICDKTFIRRQTYRDHLMGHENPLIKCCTICSTQFSSGIIASKHKKKFHPELYELELQKRAAERTKRGKTKIIHHSKTEQENTQLKNLRIILNCMSLQGFVKNDWIYLPEQSTDDEKFTNNSRVFEEIKSEESTDEQNDTILTEDDSKRNSISIKPEEISHLPNFLGAKYIFNVYDERRNKKLKENRKNARKKINRDDSAEDLAVRRTSEMENKKPSELKICQICGETRTKSNILRHVASHCVEEDDRDCKICFTSHSAPNKLREHYSRVHQVKFREYLYNIQKAKMDEESNDNSKSPQNYVTCTVCFTNLKNESDLKYHHEMLHNYKPGGGKSRGTLDCHICCKTFKETQTKNLHIRRIHKQMFDGQIFCHYCGKDFMGKGYLLSHFRHVHFDENGMFREVSTKKRKIDNNKNNKDKQSFVCEICGEVKETKGTMMKHRHEKHGVLDPEYGVILQKDYEENDCPHCGKHFTSIRKFKDHEKYHQKEQPNLFCPVCGIKCKTDIFLKAHMQRHNEKTFFCEFEGCNKGFAVKYDYLTHIKRAHGSGESFPCKRCDQVFRTWKLRRNHEEVEHGIVKVKLQRNKRLTPNASYKEDEGGNCRFCGKHFGKNSYRKLQNHEYHHKKIIPNLHCEICGAKSTTEYNLKRHMERHGEIKFYCNYPGCGKGYKVKHDIRIHARRAHKDSKDTFS